ncbi:MAG: hypothetical protein CMM05_01190 [Rhodopirellula sp.]|nr:hypothetical protein [Rhodopirellula sp.]
MWSELDTGGPKERCSRFGYDGNDTENTVNVRDELSDEYDPSIIDALAQYPTGKVAGVVSCPI